jgi:hypothetical protein
MLPSPDDSRLTPDRRRREIASILARGILRLSRMAWIAPASANPGPGDHRPEPAERSLEMSATPPPSCDPRLTQPRSREEERAWR